MNREQSATQSNPSDEIAGLVQTLHKTQQRLAELTRGQVDAVLEQGGHSYLLHEAQGKLRESESDQRRLATTMTAILNALPARICLLHANGVIASVNTFWYLFALFNNLTEHLVDRNYLESCDRASGMDTEDAHQIAAGIRAVIAGTKRHFSLEYCWSIPGERLWFEVVVTPVGDERPGGVVVMHVNITERRLAAEALRATASSLAVSQSIANLGSWEMDLNNLDDLRRNSLAWSDEMYRLMGYEPRSVMVTPDFYLQHIPGTDRSLIEERLKQIISVNAQHSYFYPITRSDGESRIVHTQAEVLRDEKTGRPLKLIGTVHDVTEAKMNEERLSAGTALLEAQLNSTLDGILIVNSEQKMVLQNNRMVDLWKVPAEFAWEPDNRRRLDWVARQVKDKEMFLSKVKHLYETPDEIGRDELELIDGRYFDRYSAPVRGRDGRNYGRIWVYRDVSERKKAEKKTFDQIELMNMAGRVGKLGAWAAEYPGPRLIWSEEVYRIHEVDPDFKPDHESTLCFFTPESRRILEEAIQNQKPYDLELEIITAKGNKRSVRSTSALEFKGGKVSRLYGIFQDITDRKRQESRVRRLIDSNVQCVLIWNRNGAVTEANDAFCNLVGYSREDLTSGRINWMHLTPPEEACLDAHALEEINELGVCTPYEKHYIRKDGVRVPILIGSAIFEDSPDEGAAFVVDLTQQKRTERRFAKMVESNAQGVMFWKASGPITGGNDAFLNLVGYTREDLEAGRLDWKALTPSEYREADRNALEQIEAGGRCEPMEKEWIRKDGSRVPVYLSAAAFEDTPDEGVTFALDLTERKRIEARFRRLSDSNVQNVMFWKKNGEVTDANDAFLKLIGYTRDDLQAGRINWRTLTPPEYVEADNRAMEEIQANGVCKTYEKEYVRKNGSRVPVLIGGASFEDNPDEGVRFVLDLTEIKKLEHQFLRAQRMESIGTLAGGIAHDLNNILAPIMMAVQVMKMKTTDAQLKKILETIEVSSQRGADIVRQVLSFARGLQGERLEVQPLHLLKDIEAIIRDTFPKNIQRDINFPEDAWTILGDPTQLHQILLNLCVNSRDAMPDGGSLSINIENAFLDEHYVAMNPQAKTGRYVIINVTDSGQGIPPEIVDKIFDPFFTTKETGKGTGLGLSTVAAIVKSHAGFVNVYSELGKGSSFKVYLPAIETQVQKPKGTMSLAALPRGRGEKVLVVDDENSILTITSETLGAFGYKTLTASDGAEAIAIYAQNRDTIKAIVTDMAMPVMDGPATIRALFKINPQVKIIAATGLKTEGSEAKALNAGVKHFLLKPYTASTLLKTLRSVLDEGEASPRV